MVCDFWLADFTNKLTNIRQSQNFFVNYPQERVKDFLIAALTMTDSEFPLQLWDKLAPQVQNTLNLLRASRINPNILPYDALNSPYNWD
jgi:hypothetical protein